LKNHELLIGNLPKLAHISESYGKFSTKMYTTVNL